MGLTPLFTEQDVLRQLNGGYRAIENAIIAMFSRIGEEWMTNAVEALQIDPSTFPKGDYQDRTAHLRNSIGYFVLKDGVIISSKLGDIPTATAAAKMALGQVPKKSGYQLIGVAGMEYASRLESKGYNVITSQKEVALVDLEKMLKDYRSRMNKKGVDAGFTGDNFITTAMR